MSEQGQALQQARQQMQERWATMAPRERRMVQMVGLVVVVLLLVMVGLRPAWRTLSVMPERMQAIESELETMRRLAQESQVLRQRPPVPPMQAEAALRSASERLGGTARLSLQAERATLTFTDIPGEALADWLQEARGAARARVTEAEVQPAAMGAYSGSITLALGSTSAER